MRYPYGIGVAVVCLAAACGSETSDGPGDGPALGTSSGNGGGYTCVPDDDAGPSPKSVKTLTGGATPLCPPGTHAVPNGSTNDGASSGASGGTSGTSGSSGASGSGGASSSSGSSNDGNLPPTPTLCKTGGVNNEPDILVGYSPANGQTVGANGQIKVWVNDEGAPKIAPNEQIDPNTGAITTPGDRAAKAADGYLWEPALYIAPQTAENGGTPHFPTAIKGYYNNQPQLTKSAGTLVAGMDPPPPGSTLADKYTGEDIWDVSSLGLGPGTYIAEFVIHDGDRDRGVGCVTIVIQ